MRLTRPSGLTVLTIAILLLLPALAVLQYRWVGQVSDAERARMERNLRVAASQFREAFDDQIARAVNGLRADATTVREQAWYRYADRYAAWVETAEHPRVVANVFLVTRESGALALRRWSPQAHVFEPAAWSAPLIAWRPRFEQGLSALAARQPIPRAWFPDDDSLIVAPLLVPLPRPAAAPPVPAGGVLGFTVLQLDMAYVRDALLPALTDRHFRDTDGDRYRLAVMARSDPGEVIYRSDPGAPTEVADADEVQPLYGAFRDPLAFFQRGRGERPRVVFRNREGPEDREARARFAREVGRWILLVQHESGSLEAAVAHVRVRNLAISVGVLLLLSGSMGLLALSSRRAQRLARQQMEFVAGVSHELRTPVAVIRSAAENLAHGVVGSGDRVRQYGQMIELEARRLGEMVEQVLQYAGIAAGLGGGARGPLAPADIIDAALDAAAPALGSATVQRLIAPDLPPVLGEAAALRSAVQNLIVNAAKYGGPDGWVGVRAERAARGQHTDVLLTVEDHGPGIPQDELPHIFEPFYRGGQAISRQVHGNGLGLSLVRQIVAAHGGRVTVSTRAGAGSSFTIALPAADAVTTASHAPHAAPDAVRS